MLNLSQAHAQSINHASLASDISVKGCEKHADKHVVDSQILNSILHRNDTLIVDLRSYVEEDEGYIPGAVHLNYNDLIKQSGAAEGLIPDAVTMSKVLSSIGLKPWHFVVAYDDETGVEAARLLWSLASVGHGRYALLDGGFQAWVTSGMKTEGEARIASTSTYCVEKYTRAIVHQAEVLRLLKDENTVIVDTRSAAEYSGEEQRADKGGHIPGAVHFNWMEAIDLLNDGGLRDADKLLTKLRVKGITPDKHVIVYCQSNRRSAHTFVVLKWLGFENVSAYDGSWSEWGNDSEMPVEVV